VYFLAVVLISLESISEEKNGIYADLMKLRGIRGRLFAKIARILELAQPIVNSLSFSDNAKTEN